MNLPGCLWLHFPMGLQLKASTKSSHYVKRSRSVGFYEKAGKLHDCNQTHCTLTLAMCMLLLKGRRSNSRRRAFSQGLRLLRIFYVLALFITFNHDSCPFGLVSQPEKFSVEPTHTKAKWRGRGHLDRKTRTLTFTCH